MGEWVAMLMLWFPPTGTMTPMRTQHALVGQTYEVPLIQPDLRREEVIQQVADALQYLQKVSGDIFSRWVPPPPLSDLSFPRKAPSRSSPFGDSWSWRDPAGFPVPQRLKVGARLRSFFL